MCEIVITESYRKKTFTLLRIDPFHTVLDCKKLKGYSELYRIRLTANTRIVIEIIPVDINTRESIY